MGSLRMVVTTIERTAGGIVIAGRRLGNHRPPGPAIYTIRTVQQHEQLEQLRFVGESQATVDILIGTMTESAASKSNLSRPA